MLATLTAVAFAAATLAGHLESHSVRDAAGREHRVEVYLPPGYDATAAAYDLLVVFDGDQHIKLQSLPQVLEKLASEGKAPRVVAAFVDNGMGPARLDELANRAAYTQWVAATLVPWLRQSWNVSRAATHTFVMGSSAGGLAAANVALFHPDLFGNVLSQSGAFWRGSEASNAPPYEWLTAQARARPRGDVRFVLDIGTGEDHAVLGGHGPNALEANRRFAAALREKGYAVDFREVQGGVHSPESWATALPSALERLFAREPSR